MTTPSFLLIATTLFLLLHVVLHSVAYTAAFSRSKQPPAVIFCTSELEGLTAGGAGVVVADSARSLLLAGWHVLIVLDLDDGRRRQDELRSAVNGWRQHVLHQWGMVEESINSGWSALSISLLADVLTLAGRQQDPVAEDAESLLAEPLYRQVWRKSKHWAWAVEHISGQAWRDDGIPHPSLFSAVEFWDCGAPAYHTLLWRLQRIEGPSTRTNMLPQIWVRTHGLHQAIAADTEHGDIVARQTSSSSSSSSSLSSSPSALQPVYWMETRALQMADTVIANTPGTAREYQHTHNLDSRRVVVIPPTLGTLLKTITALAAAPLTTSSSHASPNLLVYGKLQKAKGPDLAVKALVNVMQRSGAAATWHGVAIFAGDDLPCDTQPTVNMSTCIVEKYVPDMLRSRFRFVGRINRHDLGAFAHRHMIRAAILPSRYETFCLAAHEAAYYRLPLVLPRIAAYEDYFNDESSDETRINAIMFQAGSVEDLARAIAVAINNDRVLDRTVANNQDEIAYPDPAAGYRQLLLF